MDESLIVLYAIGWAACSILNYGFQVAHFQRKYKIIAYEHRVEDRVWAGMFAMLGPIALFTTVMMGQFKHGWMV